MRESRATVRERRVRRGAGVWLLAATLAACGGNTDVSPAAATVAAAADAAALATAIASVVATTTRATATPASTATLPPTPAPTATPAPPLTAAVGNATARGATPTPLSAAVATNTRAATGNATAGATAGATPSGTVQRPPSSTGAANPTAPAPVVTAAMPFADPAKRFTFSRPGLWREAPAMTASRDLVVGYLSTAPRGSFNVLASSVSASATLEQYTGANIATIKRDVMGYRDGPVGLQSGALGGVPAQLYDFFATVGGEQQLVTQIYCVRGNTLYVLSFIAPADATTEEERNGTFYDAAQVIVDTWKFL